MNRLERLGRDFLNSFTPFNFSSNIGSYGDIIFSTVQTNVLTPENLDLDISSKIENHDNLGEVPYTEFIHRNLRTVSLNIKLVYTLSDVETALSKLEKICENGEYYPLIVGGMPLSKYGFMLTNFKQGIKSTNANGRIEIVNCSLTLKEYNPKIDRLILPASNKLTTGETATSKKNSKKNKKVLSKKSKEKVYSKEKNEKEWLIGVSGMTQEG